MFTKREELLARFRLLFDFLQVTGLLMTLGSHEPRWFVVRDLRQSMIAVMSLTVVFRN